ncbi:MAG: phosphotransferase [Acidobacteriota bacterium]
MTLHPRARQAPDDVIFLDASDPDAVDAYLLSRGLAAPADLPSHITRAGDGNMNLTLRVRLRDRSVIVKQGRPWVEKYKHIPAPWDRTLVEGAFYRAVSGVPEVAGRMPALLDLDAVQRILVLEDLGTAGDYTSLYAGGTMDGEDLDTLLAWLAALARIAPPPAGLANRAMRQLNHEHMFRLPLAADNGLNLEAFTPGLSSTARALQQDVAYRARVTELGTLYLADGATLVHGDYFPGSWVRTAGGVRIIDPEFCFAGTRAFDYGVMLAHLALGGAGTPAALRVVAAARAEKVEERLVLGFAGVEIMRRLLGVAQLPLSLALDGKQRLLALSRALVADPGGALACWP